MATSGAAATIRALVAVDGTASTTHATALLRRDTTLRDLADAVHALCLLHGAFPGIVDHVAKGAVEPEVADWLAHALDGVAAERAMLAKLTAAVGPLPSTPGQAESEAAMLAQAHALEMLARSDRSGCGLGTAMTFVLDWGAVRTVLAVCAARVGIDFNDNFATLEQATQMALDTLVVSPAAERAMVFGAQQMLAQHRGLWDLLEARASARGAL